MTDHYRLSVRITNDFTEDATDALFAIDLPGSISSGVEQLYGDMAVRMLAGAGIYPWRVRDTRECTSIGASAEMRDVVIFLTGAASVALTNDLVKRILDALHTLAKHAAGRDAIDDAEAVAIAVAHHRMSHDHSDLRSFECVDDGVRRLKFADGTQIEVDKRGRVLRSLLDDD